MIARTLTIGTAISVALSAHALSGALVALALAYARLREVKKVAGRSLADVFT